MANQNNKNKTNSNNKKKVNNSKNNNVKKDIKKDVKKEVKVKEEVKEIKPIVEEVKKVEVVKEEVVVNETKKKSSKLTNTHKDLILVLLVVILFIVAIFVTVKKTPDIDIELPVAVEGTPGFTEISYAEYEAKMAEKKPFLVVIVQDGCGYCDMFKPVVEEASNEYDFPVYYINITKLSAEESDALSTSNSFFRRNNRWGTPTTLFMYGDTVVDVLSQYKEKEEFVEFVKENIKVDNNEEK